MYFVKSVSRATEANKNFAGLEQVCITGKGEKVVAMSGSAAEATYTVQEFFPAWAREYGYKRECDARRSWTFRHPENSEFWKEEASIIWIDC